MIFDLANPATWLSLFILTALEIILGIDNIIFLALSSARLPKSQQPLARKIGLALALAGRIIFLSSVTWVMALKDPVTDIGDFSLSWRDIIFLSGGAFLIYKSTSEIHQVVTGAEETREGRKHAAFGRVILQIGMFDVIFALDSMITAVGLSQQLWVMIMANVFAMFIMLFAAAAVGRFIERYPTVRMLALAFLMMVGLSLVADGLHNPLPREYIYAAIGFSSAIECLNVLTRSKAEKRKKKK